MRRNGLWLGWLLALTCLAAVPAGARDVFVLLSGGGTPLTNNYSQYLQAQALARQWQTQYPPDAVWVFFGIGNRTGEPATLADVRRQVRDHGHLRETWLPGFLPANRPARKTEFLRALREEILPAVSDGGTLHLFVGDHGTLGGPAPREGAITLWELERQDGGWRTVGQELTVTELRTVLAAGLGRGRVVFCMTQCHSGGFHHLGVPRQVTPPAAWFTAAPPAWAETRRPEALPPVAGFTATDEPSLAAGCDPDPDPDQWAGYERFVPEALLGQDLFTGAMRSVPLPSFAAAHTAAVQVDETIDKPRSSSEQYLAVWADVIERLAAEPALAPKVKKAVSTYQAAVDRGLVRSWAPGFRAKRREFARYVDRLGEQNPKVAPLVRAGTRTQLDEILGPAENRAGRPSRNRGRGPTPRGQLWRETVRPAWQHAVEAGRIAGLIGPALDFERHLLRQEGRGRELMFTRGWSNPMLREIYWQSGYADPGTVDPARAEAVSRWGAWRLDHIVAWAESAPDPAVRAAAEKLGLRKPQEPAGRRTLSPQIAAERTLFYRRVLAAWAFLHAVKHAPALAQLHELIALENRPLPSPAAG